MADVKKTIEIIFAGTDNLSKTLGKIGDNAEQFGQDLQDIGAPFADATDKVLLLEAAVVALALAGIKASSDIESAATKMANSLGLPVDQAEKFKEIAKDVYTAGIGDDMVTAFEAVTLAQKKFGDNAEVDIGKVTGEALKLQAVFGSEFDKNLASVNTLMTNFGLTSTQAFDFITKGFQDGLDGSGDFLESINEYSTQFSNGGADAEQFFSVLSSGFQEGMLGTDRAADLFKEFRVRIQDDSKTTKEALESIGIDPEAFAANLASGEMTAIEAFDIIQKKLNETADVTVQFNAGVGLMGTQFEDLGTAAALAIDTTSVKIEDLAGAIDSLDTDTFEKKFVSTIRTITTEFGSLTQWEDAKDRIGVVFADIAASFGPAMDKADFSGLEDAVGEIWTKIQNIFIDNDLDLTTVEGMADAIDLVIDTLESLQSVTSGIVDIFGTFVGLAIDVAEVFNSMSPGMKEFIGNVLGIGTALVTLGGVIAVGGALISSLGTLAGLFASGGTLVSGIAVTSAALTGMMAHPAFALAAAGTIGFGVGTSLREIFPSIDEYTQKMIRAADSVLNFSGQSGEVDLSSMEKELDDVSTAALTLFEIEGRKEITVVLDDSKADFRKAIDDINNFEKAAKEARNTISWFDEEGKEHRIDIPVEVSGIEETQKELEKIPTEKILEIRLQGDIDTDIALITAQADVAQAAFEFQASVDIAGIEAAAEVAVAAFDSVGDTVSSLSESTADMFGALLSGWEDLSDLEQSQFQDIVEDQQEAQNKALEAQVKLTDAQTAATEARTAALERGDALITFNVSPELEPAFDLVLRSMLKYTQTTVTAEGADMLLGL